MTHRHELAAYQRALMLTVDLREFTKTVAAALKDGHSFVNVMLTGRTHRQCNSRTAAPTRPVARGR